MKIGPHEFGSIQREEKVQVLNDRLNVHVDLFELIIALIDVDM